MKIQSISIVVPTKRCVNNCPFCVSRMHDNEYEDNFDFTAYRKRIKYAIMNGVTTLIITGTGEALQNKSFLEKLRDLLVTNGHPFPNIELQTTGVFLNQYKETIETESGNVLHDYYNISLLKEIGVNTISLSVSDIFDSENNLKIIGTPDKLKFNLPELISVLKVYGFNIRLSVNMINVYTGIHVSIIINKCKELGANQITFRKMYYSYKATPEDNWVRDNRASDDKMDDINLYVSQKGNFLYTLPFGAKVYSIWGMSVAVDSDCMSKEEYDSLKYVILREDGKLYCRWDDEGSLIF